MNRWFGSAADSQQQASERDRRAARRTIAGLSHLVLSDSEDDFNDCNTTLGHQVDGQDDESVVEESEAMTSAAAELARQKALPVDEANYANDEDAWKKEIKLKFDQGDVKYWFNSVESQMKKFGINMQWD